MEVGPWDDNILVRGDEKLQFFSTSPKQVKFGKMTLLLTTPEESVNYTSQFTVLF